MQNNFGSVGRQFFFVIFFRFKIENRLFKLISVTLPKETSLAFAFEISLVKKYCLFPLRLKWVPHWQDSLGPENDTISCFSEMKKNYKEGGQYLPRNDIGAIGLGVILGEKNYRYILIRDKLIAQRPFSYKKVWRETFLQTKMTGQIQILRNWCGSDFIFKNLTWGMRFYHQPNDGQDIFPPKNWWGKDFFSLSKSHNLKRKYWNPSPIFQLVYYHV